MRSWTSLETCSTLASPNLLYLPISFQETVVSLTVGTGGGFLERGEGDVGMVGMWRWAKMGNSSRTVMGTEDRRFWGGKKVLEICQEKCTTRLTWMCICVYYTDEWVWHLSRPQELGGLPAACTDLEVRATPPRPWRDRPTEALARRRGRGDSPLPTVLPHFGESCRWR